MKIKQQRVIEEAASMVIDFAAALSFGKIRMYVSRSRAFHLHMWWTQSIISVSETPASSSIVSLP
jgi:hypothetical protein